MSDHAIQSIVTIVTAIIGVAILAVIVGQKSQTTSVIGAASSGLANDISAAVAPVTGATATINTGSSGFGLGGFSGLGAPIAPSTY